MRTWLFILGLLISFFGVYPPFSLLVFIIGIIILIVGIASKSKENKK